MTRNAVFLTIVCFSTIVFAQQQVPENLTPPAGQVLKMQVHGSGDQVYFCDGSKWVLRAPDAKLFDDAGREVGTHFKGPTWRWSDGSQVTAKPVANASPDPDSIPWLLLTVADHSGSGALTDISSIQRLRTKGGKAPESGCDSSHKDAETRSHYSADYCFYSKTEP